MAGPQPVAEPQPAAGLQPVAETQAAAPPAAPEPVAPAEPRPASVTVVAPRPAASGRRIEVQRIRLRRAARRAQTQVEAPVCVVTGPNGECLFRSNRCDFLGTEGDDTLDGTSGPEVICGLGGNDVLSGGGGDTLIGGPGENTFENVTPDDCVVSGDSVDQAQLEACRQVATFLQAEEPTGGQSPPPPPPPPPPPRTDGGDGHPPVVSGGGPGVVSGTAGAGQVYVALSRYLQAGEAQDHGSAAIAVILDPYVEYDNGKLHFLLRCSYAGDGRVVLTAVDKNGRLVRLGAVSFHCSGERDDPDPVLEVSPSGRRLLERSTRIRIRAEVLDTALERQPAAARQAFVLPP